MKTANEFRGNLNLHHGRYRGEGQYNMPLLKRTDIHIPTEWIGFHEVNSFKGDCTHTGVHFFLDDYHFERVWKSPTRYLRMLRQFALVATPDFSMYMDYPKAMQIWNHYRKQWLGSYWQREGISVIPTISWSDEGSLDWCMDGVPKEMPVIVSAIGIGRNKAAESRFRVGYERMLHILRPKEVISYGSLPQGCQADRYIGTHVERVRDRVNA